MISAQLFLAAILFSYLLVCLVAYLFLARREKETGDSQKLYTGGEKIDEAEIQIPSHSFYYSLRKFLWPFYTFIADRHNGDISGYMTWILVTFIIIALTLFGGLLWA